MNIEHEEIQAHAEPENETESTSQKKKKKQLINWHRIFNTEQELALTSVAIEVYQEVELMSKPPRADLLLLRNQHPHWTEEQRARLPDGIRDTDASHVLIELKYTESTNIWAIRQAMFNDYIYMESKLRDNPEFDGDPEAVLSTFLLSSKSPSQETLAGLGFYPTDKAGIYQCDDLIKGRVTILSLNDLAREPHNALVKCFASKPAEQEAAFTMLVESGMLHVMPDLLWLLQGLEKTLVERGGLKMREREDVVEITPEYLIEVGKSIFEQNLPHTPVDMILRHVSAERILSHLDPQERIAGLRPEERIAGLRPEERIAGLRPEEVLGGFRVAGFRPEEILEEFKPEELQQSAVIRQTLTEYGQQEQQRMLLRSLRRKFEAVPADIVTLIQLTSDSEQLDIWMDQMIDAETLEDIKFSATIQPSEFVAENKSGESIETDAESDDLQSDVSDNSSEE